MAKRAINGLKLSQQMAALHLRWDCAERNIFAEMCSRFTEAQINLAYCTTAFKARQACGFCCIDSSERVRATGLIAGIATSAQFCGWFHPVGILHFYPHHSSLRVLGQTLETLACRNIEVYAFSSSISSLGLVVDHCRLHEAAAVLMDCFQVPENFAPVVAERVVRQVKPTG